MSKVTVKYEDGLKTDLADPFEAVAYLNAALEEGSQDSSPPRPLAEARHHSSTKVPSSMGRYVFDL
jgi:hypothetical protein